MNQKELGELRRRFQPDRSAINHVYACFVSSAREIILDSDLSLTLLPKEEGEQYLALLKKTLSGTLDKNLLPVTFSTQQVMEGAPHRLLRELRDSKLQDPALRRKLYEAIRGSLEWEGSYLILLAFDRYDVPYKGADGETLEDSSDTVFSYFVCAVCPVKEEDPQLGYFPKEKEFHCVAGQTVTPPALGFLFPAFDDRAANIYSALLYARKAEEPHPELVEGLFGTRPPVTAGQQKEGFHTALTEALEEECGMDVVQAVHEQLVTRIADHKESRDPEPLAVSSQDLAVMLQSSGISRERADKFRKECDDRFGEDAALNPANLIGSRRFEIKTEKATLSLAAEDSYLVEERIIDGRRYLLIPAEDGMELNGLPIRIKRTVTEE